MTKLSAMMREVGRQVVGEAIGEIFLLRIAAQVLERQDDDRETRRGRELIVNGGAEQPRREPSMPGVGARRDNCRDECGGDRRPAQESGRFGRGLGLDGRVRRRRHRRPLDLGRLSDLQRKDVDRLGDVLQLRRAEIADLEIKPLLDLTIGVLRQANRARLGDPLQSCGDIDSVAHEVAVALLDDVA